MSENQKVNLYVIKDQITEIERLINKVNGVISSKLVVNQDNEIEEIHVLSDLTRGPKQIVRDIQSSVAAVYGLLLDHRIISVAQIDSGIGGESEIRLQVSNVQVIADNNKLTVKVSLSYNNEIFEGVASGTNSLSSNPRTAVNAILSAVHSFLSEECVFTMIDLQKLKIANRDAFMVVIGFVTDYGEELLTGSSLVKHDEYHAIIRATLDAINRRLGKIYRMNRK